MYNFLACKRSFRLLNVDYTLSLNDWCHYFQLLVSDVTVLRAAFRGMVPTPNKYFNMMSLTTPINKGKYIQCPAIRYLFYVIANTL